MTPLSIGISGLASYLPAYRVQLEHWCDWTSNDWSKIRSVVGSSFRMRGPDENAYTMAANAVLKLIEQYDIDPQRIGFLGLGTESSSDNSAGAIIIKGMLNQALAQRGLSPLRRQCEVPEFKHACLGGVYAMKAAARYLAFDGQGKAAIVVCTDIAEYQRGTSGEPTQGAGAVAMLIESEPKLLEFELEISGCASDYRGPDFRKPFSRFSQQNPTVNGQLHDFPVFNGKYSTACYVDAVILAVKDMFAKISSSHRAFMTELAAVYLHRPYRRMAENGLCVSYLCALASEHDNDPAAREELAAIAQTAGLTAEDLVAELNAEPDLYQLVQQESLSKDAYPLTMSTIRAFRNLPTFQTLVLDKLMQGEDAMSACGNLYTASLPAWMAAGLEQAANRDAELSGQRILMIGYGSGDAAESIPMRVVPGWRDAASKLRFSASLKNAVDLDQQNYELLHDRCELAMPGVQGSGSFIIDRIGERQSHFDDTGIEYYRYLSTSKKPS